MFNAYTTLFLRFMTQSWHTLNDTRLGGALSPPVFNISEGSKTLGSWHYGTRTLSLSAQLLLNRAEHEVVDVLRHEMAHQYADEVLGSHGEKPHGSGFRHACQLLDIHHHASTTLHSEASPMLQRIRKLLALSESQNENEASLAMTKAKQLMEKYELDLADEPDDFCFQYLGEPRKQKSAVAQFIATTLVRHFNIQCIWIPSNLLMGNRRVWLLEACGNKANLEVAGYVFDYLTRELEFLWRGHQRTNPGLKGRAPKREYQLGVLRGFMNKLTEEQAVHTAQRELVLMRHARVLEFFQKRHPNIKTGRKMSWRETDAYKAGFQQGRELEIRQGVKRGQTSRSLTADRLIGNTNK